MVVLTIVTQKNRETVYFEGPIPKINCMKILSCSLYNSWYNLESTGSVIQKVDNKNCAIERLPPGHYNLKALAQKLSELFKELKAETNQPSGQFVITKEGSKDILVDQRLVSLFNLDPNVVSPTLDSTTTIERINYETAYFIHCDIIDRTKNFFNGKRSDLLAKFDVKGEPYQKVNYSSREDLMRDCSTGAYVNSITLSVRDENGNLFDFKGMPLEFELGTH